MDVRVQEFLSRQRVCVLTTLLLDGSPHGATLHFSHKDTPFELYVGTTRESRKVEALLSGDSIKAAMVIGFSEEEWKTIQLDGEVQIAKDDELESIHTIHYEKHPQARRYKASDETVFLKFTPYWWRFSDLNSDPPDIISSERREQ